MKMVLCDVRNPSQGFCGFTGFGVNMDLSPRELRENVSLPEKAIEGVVRAGLQVRVIPEEAPAPAPAPAPEPVVAVEPEPSPEPSPEVAPEVAPEAASAPSLSEALQEKFTRKELIAKCDELKIPNYGNKEAVADRLADGRTAEEFFA